MNNFVMKVQQRGRKRTEEWGVRKERVESWRSMGACWIN